MSLWGNNDSVYSDGTIAVNLGTNTVTGAVGVVTFTSAGIKTGDVITVGTGLLMVMQLSLDLHPQLFQLQILQTLFLV
jgi:hypothetical protein